MALFFLLFSSIVNSPGVLGHGWSIAHLNYLVISDFNGGSNPRILIVVGDGRPDRNAPGDLGRALNGTVIPATPAASTS
jgi:hypothetical protein